MFAILGIGILIFLFSYRYLLHRERLMMISKGLTTNYRPGQRYNDLRNSLALIGIGLGTLLAYSLEQTFHVSNVVPFYIGFVSVFGGIGLFISFLIQGRENKSDRSS